jgi:hypothetical protein
MLDLLEAEGLTADHVRAWLQRKGFTLHEVRSGRQCWVRGTEAVVDDGLTASGTLVYLASVVAECSLQSLLAQINPRMQPGWPTDEELERHSKNGGVWIGSHGSLGDGGSIVFLSFDREQNDVAIWDGEEWHNAEQEMVADMHENWSFWPCDAHGNKVRRGKV